MDSSHGEENTDPIVNVAHQSKLFYDQGQMLSHIDMTELYWDKTIFYLLDYFAWGIG